MDQRGTGRTTKQMQAAKKDAIFVCNHQKELFYCKSLANHLGRGDLTIVSKEWITDERWQGRSLTEIVVDHFVYQTELFTYKLHCARTRIRS